MACHPEALIYGTTNLSFTAGATGSCDIATADSIEIVGPADVGATGHPGFPPYDGSEEDAGYLCTLWANNELILWGS